MFQDMQEFVIIGNLFVEKKYNGTLVVNVIEITLFNCTDNPVSLLKGCLTEGN